MKKFFALLLTVVMMMSLATVAFGATYDKDGNAVTNTPAGPTYNDVKTITITKNYNLTNAGTTSPAENFGFTALTCTTVTDAAAGVTTGNAPVPTIGTANFAAGGAGGAAQTATITLPDYTAVGVYTYTFSEVAGNTAGVDYYGDEITLVVTVVEQNGKVRVAAVHTEGAGEAKSDAFANVYSAGSLEVKKTVTGNLGDKTKEFTITVTFNAPANKTVKEAISYVVDGKTETIAAGEGWTGSKTVTLTLKDSETVTFTNIPYGVTYTVVEADYTGEGYDEARGEVDTATAISQAEHEVNIINNKSADVDTGILMDSAPYVVMLLVAAAGLVLFTNKRRVQD